MNIGNKTEKIIEAEFKKSKGKDTTINRFEAIKNIRQQLSDFYLNDSFEPTELLKRLNVISYNHKKIKEFVMSITLGVLSGSISAYLTAFTSEEFIKNIFSTNSFIINMIVFFFFLIVFIAITFGILRGVVFVLNGPIKSVYSRDYDNFVYPYESNIIRNILKAKYHFDIYGKAEIVIPQKRSK